VTPAVICLFAKAPRAGTVKTRLAPELGSEGAADLAAAFLQDTLAALSRLDWAELVIAANCTKAELAIGFPHAQVWPQGSGDLGARIERVLARALEQADIALALGADTPGLPPRLLDDARRALALHDAVIGPAEDGGFYLLGLRRCPEGLLSGLPWSTELTFRCTLERLRHRGFHSAVLPPWFDVDRPSDLVRLRRFLDHGEIEAHATAAALRRIDATRA
jgi:uncharacterized protein